MRMIQMMDKRYLLASWDEALFYPRGESSTAAGVAAVGPMRPQMGRLAY